MAEDGDVFAFYLPPINAELRQAGARWRQLRRRLQRPPEVQAFQTYLSTDTWATRRARRPRTAATSAPTRAWTSPSDQPDRPSCRRRSCRTRSAVFRFDGSDQMPGCGRLRLVVEGADRLDHRPEHQGRTLDNDRGLLAGLLRTVRYVTPWPAPGVRRSAARTPRSPADAAGCCATRAGQRTVLRRGGTPDVVLYKFGSDVDRHRAVRGRDGSGALPRRPRSGRASGEMRPDDGVSSFPATRHDRLRAALPGMRTIYESFNGRERPEVRRLRQLHDDLHRLGDQITCCATPRSGSSSRRSSPR